MRKFILIIFCFFSLIVSAKTTYIPTYANKLILIDNGRIDSIMNQQYLLSNMSQDGLISCAIVQQVVSPELVKSIKKAKSAAGWAVVAAALSSASAGYSEGQMNSGRTDGYTVSNYVDARELTRESLAESAGAKALANDLMTLLADLLIKNNSEKEMVVTDMDRGLVWFVLPHSEISLPLDNGEECHFRISSCAPLDENVKYVNATANSTLEKYTVGLETDMYWYVPLNEKNKKSLGFTTDWKSGYIRIDKETMVMVAINTEEFQTIKANYKEEE